MGDEDSCNGNTDDKKTKREATTEAYLSQIVKEKHQLDKDECPVANRLLDEELKRATETGKAAFDYRYVDLYNEKPIKVTTRVMFPTKDVPTFNFVGKLLGPKGNTLKQLQEQTQCRMFILGKGSMRDKAKEESLRNGGDPKYAHLSDELHVEVSCLAPPSEAHSRMAFALRELRAVLTPDPMMEDGYPPYMEDMGMMRGSNIRGGAMPPPIPHGGSKAKVMGLLEKARHSMEYQPPMPPRRFGPPRGYPNPFPRGGDDGRGTWVSGNYKPVGGGFFPQRTTPYARP